MMLSPGMYLAKDIVTMAKDLSTEFVQLVSSKCKEITESEHRANIQPHHVLKALQELGFEYFVTEVEERSKEFKEIVKAENLRKRERRKTGADRAGMSEEEQILLQQQMFAEAHALSAAAFKSAAAMHAAYEQAMAAQQHAQAGPGAAHPHYPYPQYQQQQQHMQQAGGSDLVQQRQAGHGPSGGGGGGGGCVGGWGPAGATDMEDDYDEDDDDDDDEEEEDNNECVSE
ncbi:hypothetical protein PLESTF_001196600 [Pleodorina starrii]|nr:hypothetical protein PLESTF_001196600 [Pleodorina starrii]